MTTVPGGGYRVDPDEQGLPQGRPQDAGGRRGQLPQRVAKKGTRSLRVDQREYRGGLLRSGARGRSWRREESQHKNVFDRSQVPRERVEASKMHANTMKLVDGLLLESYREVAKTYPGIKSIMRSLLITAVCN
ncbi:unnamed protein product [Musa banksii]